MKVKYLYHSGFLVELEDKYLIFDYWKGKIPKLDSNKEIYVFFSHSHEDHYNSEIFELLKKYKKVFYILSNDIVVSPASNILLIGPNDERTFNNIYVKTLKSSDQGVAFLVNADYKKIYHAGDLNWWHWATESNEYNATAEKLYKNEIDKLNGENIDIAFVVLDPRQDSEFFMGLDYFMKTTDTKKVYPMHMWDHYEAVDVMKNMLCAISYKDKIENKNFYLD